MLVTLFISSYLIRSFVSVDVLTLLYDSFMIRSEVYLRLYVKNLCSIICWEKNQCSKLCREKISHV